MTYIPTGRFVASVTGTYQVMYRLSISNVVGISPPTPLLVAVAVGGVVVTSTTTEVNIVAVPVAVTGLAVVYVPGGSDVTVVVDSQTTLNQPGPSQISITYLGTGAPLPP